MSAEAMTAVWEHGKGTPGQRNTLLALANRADEHGICWPGIPELVAKTKMTRRGVQYALRALEKSGQLTRLEGAEGGRGVTPLYWIKMPGLDGDVKGANRRRKGANGRRTAPPKGADDGEKGRKREPKRANPTSPEPLREETEKETTPPPSPLTEEFEAWLSHHQATTGMAPPRVGTQARDKVFAMYRARREEGQPRCTAADLELATVGAYTNEWRREQGHFGHVSVLRPEKTHELVEAGRRVAKAKPSGGRDKWVEWVSRELPDLDDYMASRAVFAAQAFAAGRYDVTPELVRTRLGLDAEAA